MHATWDYPQEKENHRELSSCVFTSQVHAPKHNFLFLISKVTHHITRKAAMQNFDSGQITFLQVSPFTLPAEPTVCHITQEPMHFQEISSRSTQQSLDSWQYPREIPVGCMSHPSSGCTHPTRGCVNSSLDHLGFVTGGISDLLNALQQFAQQQEKYNSHLLLGTLQWSIKRGRDQWKKGINPSACNSEIHYSFFSLMPNADLCHCLETVPPINIH